jgi:hypothetical protein
MASRRRACWLLAASLGVVAGGVGGFAYDQGLTVAQPGGESSCMSIGNIFGIPGLGDDENVMSNIAIGNGGNVQQTNIIGNNVPDGVGAKCCNVHIGGGSVVQTNIAGDGDCTP